MDERLTRIQELFESEDFSKEIEGVETVAELQTAFKNHGVELTLEEVDSMVSQISVANDTELNEDSLESIFGGGIAGLVLGYVVSRAVKNPVVRNVVGIIAKRR